MSTAPKTLPRQLLDLCLLRIGPQDLPYSPGLTRNLVAVTVALDIAQGLLLGFDARFIPRVLLSLAGLLGIPWLLLSWRQLQPRYAQTLVALAGSSIPFTLAFLPVALAIKDMPAPTGNTIPTAAQVLLGWLTLLMLVWKLTIDGHIFRHALELRFAGGMAIAVSMFALQVGLDRWLFAANG